MYIPKKYGQSKINSCPFCGRTAVAENPQGIPVCSKHLKESLPELKCLCGSWLEIRKGKWGPYCQCLNCGNLNLKKVLEINPIPKKDISTETKTKIAEKTSPKKTVQKEITIDSNNPDFFD